MGLENILENMKKDINRDLRSENGTNQIGRSYETDIKGHTLTLSYRLKKKRGSSRVRPTKRTRTPTPKKDTSHLTYPIDEQKLSIYTTLLDSRIEKDGTLAERPSEDVIKKITKQYKVNKTQIMAYSAWITMWTEGTRRSGDYEVFLDYLKNEKPKLYKRWNRKRAKRR